MDGFNVIPIDKENFKNIPSAQNPNTDAFKNISDSNVEIIDENSTTKAKVNTGGSFFLIISILSVFGVIFYFAFLVIQRINYLTQITSYGEQLKSISSSIDKKEIQELALMDTTLKTINQKLGGHVLNSQIFSFVNSNIRSNLQITEYKIDVKEKEVEVSLTSIAPTFKEFAEQTEKLFAIKQAGNIKSFSISNMSFETETKRLRFTTRIVFDKNAVSAVALQNSQ